MLIYLSDSTVAPDLDLVVAPAQELDSPSTLPSPVAVKGASQVFPNGFG